MADSTHDNAGPIRPSNLQHSPSMSSAPVTASNGDVLMEHAEASAPSSSHTNGTTASTREQQNDEQNVHMLASDDVPMQSSVKKEEEISSLSTNPVVKREASQEHEHHIGTQEINPSREDAQSMSTYSADASSNCPPDATEADLANASGRSLQQNETPTVETDAEHSRRTPPNSTTDHASSLFPADHSPRAKPPVGVTTPSRPTEDPSASASGLSASPTAESSATRTPTRARRVEPFFVSSRSFAPLPADPPRSKGQQQRESAKAKRMERKSKTDAMSALSDGNTPSAATSRVPTGNQPPNPWLHPSRTPLGPLGTSCVPLPLYTPDRPELDQDSSIPTYHNAPRERPQRQRPRLFELEEAPTFYPTKEEFADPLKYIKWIGEPEGGNGKEYGIVKVVPPADWHPTFVLDQERFRFPTRVQRLNSLSADARASLNYQEQLQKFHAQQGHARVSIPVVDRRPLDLYQLKLVVNSFGGYDEVARQRKWAEVTRRIGYDEKDSCHLAAQIKAAYSRIIYPFENFLRANREASHSNRSATSGPKHEDRSRIAKEASLTPSVEDTKESMDVEPAALPSPSQSATYTSVHQGSVAPEDTSMVSEQGDAAGSRRRSSRRKTDTARDAPVILSQRTRRRRNHSTNQSENGAGNLSLAPGAEEQMCEICLRGEDGISMLLCDECDRGYHMYCLDPPLTSVPRTEWYCPPCLVGTGNDYGFEEGEEHSLSSFWNRAEAFRSSWWSQRVEKDKDCIWKPENGLDNGHTRRIPGTTLDVSEDDIEREFWRLVHSPDETVEVEYGADIHSTTHGSALPTMETHPLDPYSRDGWNLNNLPILNGSLLRYIKSDISGMTVPWVYVGMMFSTFCWHNEDHYTYSINYQHFGDTKTWYGVPGGDAHKLEDALRKAAPDLFEQSPDLLFQLVTMMSPDKLKKEGVRVYAVDQRANEFVITYPKAYHSGFNQGFNLNEAVNFALPDWIDTDLECVRRYQQFNRYRNPVFSHDELIVTAYQHSQTVETAMWLQAPMREMVEREVSKRNALRELVPGIDEKLEETDRVEGEYQCAHCNVFCYLAQITSAKSTGVACLDHGNEVCNADSPTQWTLRLRFSDEQLQTMLTKTDERVSVPFNWRARLHKVIHAHAQPPLRSLRGLLHEGEKIPYPLDELDELRTFVEKANKWVEEATALIARRHHKRSAASSKDVLPGRRAKRSSRAAEEDESMVASVEDSVEQLADPEKAYMLLEEAKLLPFDAPEILALQAVVEHMEDFQRRAKALLSRIEQGEEPKLAECEEIISSGSPLSIRLDELEMLQRYVRRRKWLLEVDDLQDKFVNLDEVQQRVDEGRCLGVQEDDEHMVILHERIDSGLTWKVKAESMLSTTNDTNKYSSCQWRLSDLEIMTKASYKVAVVPELFVRLEQLQKQLKDFAKQWTAVSAQEVDATNDTDKPISKRFVEAKALLTQASVVNVIFPGELDLWHAVRACSLWERQILLWIKCADPKVNVREAEAEDAIAKADRVYAVQQRCERAVDPLDREPGQSPSRRCICRLDHAPEGAVEASCSMCGQLYHDLCLGFHPSEMSARKGRAFTCPFCHPEKLVGLAQKARSWRYIDGVRMQFPERPAELEAPLGRPEAYDYLLQAQNCMDELQREINDCVNRGINPSTPSGLDLIRHLLKRVLCSQAFNVRVDKYDKEASVFFAEVLFAHSGLDKYGEPAKDVPWKNVSPNDMRYAPRARGLNTPSSSPLMRGEERMVQARHIVEAPRTTMNVASAQQRTPSTTPLVAPRALPHHADYPSSQVGPPSSRMHFTPSPSLQPRVSPLQAPHSHSHQQPPPPSLPPAYKAPLPLSAVPSPRLGERPMLPMHTRNITPSYENNRYPPQSFAHHSPSAGHAHHSQPHPYGHDHQSHYRTDPPPFRSMPGPIGDGHNRSSMDYHRQAQPPSASSAGPAGQVPEPLYYPLADSPGEDDGKEDGRKRKRGKRARFVFQEEVGIFVPVNGARIYCLCRREESNSMVQCDRCALWYHKACVHVDDAADFGGADRWNCPMCCVKTERRYPFAEVKVREMGYTDPDSWLDVRATLRSTRKPVSKLQHWTVPEDKRIVLHLESFYPATLPSDLYGDAKRQRSNEADGSPANSSTANGSGGGEGSSTSNGPNANALGSVSRMPEWNDVRARVTPAHRTPSAEERAQRMQQEAEERQRQGMLNLYSRGVTDLMIQRFCIGWNGSQLVYPYHDEHNVFRELLLGTHIQLIPSDQDGSQFIQMMLEEDKRRQYNQYPPGPSFARDGPAHAPAPAHPSLPAPLPAAHSAGDEQHNHRPLPQSRPAPLPPSAHQQDISPTSRAALAPKAPSPSVRPHAGLLQGPASSAQSRSSPIDPQTQTRPLPKQPSAPSAPHRAPPPPAVNGAGTVNPPSQVRSSYAVQAIPPFRGKGTGQARSADNAAGEIPGPLRSDSERVIQRPQHYSAQQTPSTVARSSSTFSQLQDIDVPSAKRQKPSFSPAHPSSLLLTPPHTSGVAASSTGALRSSTSASPRSTVQTIAVQGPLQPHHTSSPPLSHRPSTTPRHQQASPRMSSGSDLHASSASPMSTPKSHMQGTSIPSPPLSARHPLGIYDHRPTHTPPPQPTSSRLPSHEQQRSPSHSQDNARTGEGSLSNFASMMNSNSASSASPSAPPQQKSPEQFRTLARMMKPRATEAEIEEMVRHAMGD